MTKNIIKKYFDNSIELKDLKTTKEPQSVVVIPKEEKGHNIEELNKIKNAALITYDNKLERESYETFLKDLKFRNPTLFHKIINLE